MKVILLQDVAKIGRKGEVTEVSNGYALNQLIPLKKAEAATPANLKKVEKMQTEKAAAAENTEAIFTEALEKLQVSPLLIEAEMNEKEHLFQAVSDTDVVEAAALKDISVSADMVVFAEPVKSAGEHTVSLRSGMHTGTFVILVSKK